MSNKTTFELLIIIFSTFTGVVCCVPPDRRECDFVYRRTNSRAHTPTTITPPQHNTHFLSSRVVLIWRKLEGLLYVDLSLISIIFTRKINTLSTGHTWRWDWGVRHRLRVSVKLCLIFFYAARQRNAAIDEFRSYTFSDGGLRMRANQNSNSNSKTKLLAREQQMRSFHFC